MNDHRLAAGNFGGEQDPAYGRLRPFFVFTSGTTSEVVPLVFKLVQHEKTD
jgi:hypothetical protein